MAERRREFIKPGARDFLALQTLQGVQCSGRGLGRFGQRAVVPVRARAEVHQTATEAEQHGGQIQSGLGQCFGVRHVSVPEIA
ncbi:hypothetical protein D3C86_1952020 [compost metagenome]